MQDSDQSLQRTRESEQDDVVQIKGTDGKEQPDQDGSGGLEKRQESRNIFTVLARLGKALCLKVKGNDCGKRRGKERSGTGSRKRTRRVITNPTETTKKKTQQTRSINKERKRRKRRSSHQMVFEFTFYWFLKRPKYLFKYDIENLVTLQKRH